MPKNYEQLSQDERDRLSLLKIQKKSLRSIARALGRSPSTISREIQRNATNPAFGLYLSHAAQGYAQWRKRKARHQPRLRDLRLKAYVRRQLRRGWSPERIAGRWKLLGHRGVSYETIYRWIYTEGREFVSCLPRAHRQRLRRGHYGKRARCIIPSRISVSMRPKVAEDRSQAGHWEADLIVGRFNRSVVQILVERKSRFTRLNRLRTKGADDMRRALNRSLSHYPKHLRRSITYDNGRENIQHLEVNRRLGTRSFFCEPMRSWEKGSVENAAGLVRRHLPKKTDFAIVPTAQIKRTERWLNGLPRKCLGFKTPAEAFRRSVALQS